MDAPVKKQKVVPGPTNGGKELGFVDALKHKQKGCARAVFLHHWAAAN